MNELEQMIRGCAERANVLNRNHFTLESVKPDCVVISGEVSPDNMNIHGYVHGGVLLCMADVVAGLTALTDKRLYVTQNTSCQFLANTKQGKFYATGTVLRRGKNIVPIRVEITSEDGKLMCECQFSMFMVNDHVDWDQYLQQK